MPVNCKSDEEINPQNGRCRKKCKSDQIRNPESGRCVKRSGAIGKRILQSRRSPPRQSPPRQSPPRQSPPRQSPPRQPNCKSDEEINPQNGRCRKKCKSDQIRNPESGRCVKRSGAIGKRILQSRRSPPRQSPPRQSPPYQTPRQSPQQATLSPDSGGRDNECRSHEVYDILSGKCVPKTSIKGAAILANRKIDMSSISPQMVTSSGLIIPRGSNVDATNYSEQHKNYLSDLFFRKVFGMYLQRRHKNVCIVGGKLDIATPRGMGVDSRDPIPRIISSMEKYLPYVKDCIRTGKRFVMFFVSIITKNGGGHANIAIYDTVRKTLERFEPNGEVSFYSEVKVNNAFAEFTTKHFGNDVTYMAPLDYCPTLGPQKWDNWTILGAGKSPALKGDPGGFCIAWSMWYADLRLSNPDVRPYNVIQNAIFEIKSKPQSFQRFIRNYSAIILRIVRKIEVDKKLHPTTLMSERKRRVKQIVDEAVRKYSS